ncbi:hypothetical protein Bbelb_049120 [Branchiostoma belcheri]|nr:hypothetical protein Bbelb_049120 [Branchiostoma belcheri]
MTHHLESGSGSSGELRCLVPGSPVLALTATASKLHRRKIQTLLSMEGCIELVENPDRANNKLHVSHVPSSAPLTTTFDWLLQLERAHMRGCPMSKIASLSENHEVDVQTKSVDWTGVRMAQIPKRHDGAPPPPPPVQGQALGVQAALKLLLKRQRYASTSYLFAKNRTDTFDAKRRKAFSVVSCLLSSDNEIIHLLVPIVGLEDKRPITMLLTITLLAGQLLPPQLLYQELCKRGNFPHAVATCQSARQDVLSSAL